MNYINQNCYHCGQPIPEKDLLIRPINGRDQSFCCHGCAGVCEVIHEAGMESFYKRMPDGDLISPPPPPNKDIEFYDFDEVQSQYVKELDSIREITLMSEAIHCAACIWLIEHTLAGIDAVQMAKVNFTNKQIKIRWDNDQIKLSSLIAKLNQIGYDATPYDASASEAAYRKANRDLLYRIAFAGFAMMNVMWFSVALYAGADEDPEFRQYFHWLGWFMATVVIIYSAKPFFTGALTSLKSRTLGMDVSISLGILTTYCYSLWVTVDPSHSGNVYFDTMIDFVFLLLIGRYIEKITKNKAIDSTKRLMDLQPKVARILSDSKEAVVPIQKLRVGDEVLVKPGDKFPVDGQVVQGESQVNESMLSGESREINKIIGSTVSAGTVNLNGALVVKVEALLQNTLLGKIVNLVEDAQGSKAPIQCTAERIMPWFISIVIALAVLSFGYWVTFDSLETALIAATAVLIITCPCAFGLATPMATAVASGVSSQHGILIKNGAILEVLNEVDHFVFDKTGTLTKGKMHIEQSYFIEGTDETRIMKQVALIESLSEHSIATAIYHSVEKQYPDLKNMRMPVEAFKAYSGKGVAGEVEGCHYLVGTADWIEKQGVQLPEVFMKREVEFGAKGFTSVWICENHQVQGILFLQDEMRDDAQLLIQSLRSRNKKITLLSGDKSAVANAVAQKLGGMEVIAEVLPEHKNQVIMTLQKNGDKVAMIGDGVNDAPALVRADVGIALGSGTDVSMDSSDVVLLNNELSAVDTAIDLSDRTLRTIRQNIASSIAYNIIMVPLAMVALLTPMVAAITMPLSSLVVILNAGRIKSFFSKKNVVARRKVLDNKSKGGTI